MKKQQIWCYSDIVQIIFNIEVYIRVGNLGFDISTPRVGKNYLYLMLT